MVERLRFTESRIPWGLKYLEYMRARGFYAQYHKVLTGEDCIAGNMRGYLKGAERVASEDHLPFDDLAAKAAFRSGIEKARQYFKS